MRQIFLFTLLITILGSCTSSLRGDEEDYSHRQCNSIYYWKTTLNLDEPSAHFLEAHNVERVYLRMFDVVKGDYGAVPNATLKMGLDDSDDHLLDSLEVVPTVYITVDALRQMMGTEVDLAQNIVNRVKNMLSFHHIKNVKELQLDCDWTESTRDSFFQLCREMKIAMKDVVPWELSCTIRLHQLAQSPPPVSRGVLMVYNVGSFKNIDAENSIIDPEIVSSYLKHLDDYPLHLDIALPTFSWQLLYRNGAFKRIDNVIDVTDTTHWQSLAPNRYVAVDTLLYNNRLTLPGDIVRVENSDYATLITVRDLIDAHMKRRKYSTVIYHFDIDNLSTYTPHEISTLYNR